MSWVRVDDGAPEHPKLLAAGAQAAWMWVCGLAYCNRQKRRDGLIPLAKVKLLYPGLGMKHAEALERVGLWERLPDSYRIHDYHEYQPDAEQAEELRAIRSAAGRLGGQRSAEAKAKQRLEANGKQVAWQANKQTSSNAPKQTSTPSRPVPSHPVPTPPAPDRSAPEAPGADAEDLGDPGRETPCPMGLFATADTNGTLVALAEKLAIPLESVRHEARQFEAYWTIGKGAGQRRTGWMGKLRQRVVEQHGRNELKPPGALEHASRHGRGEAAIAPSKYLADQLEANRTPMPDRSTP